MPKHAPITAPTRVSTGRDPPPSVCAASGRVTEVEEIVEKLGGTILKSLFYLLHYCSVIATSMDSDITPVAISSDF